MESVGPSMLTGDSVALTRLPSGSRASTIGELSSIRRPTRAAIRWMIRTRWSVSAKADVGLLQAAETLDVDLAGAVHQHVGNGRIGHQRRQRPHAERFLQKIVDQAAAFLFVQRQVLGLQFVVDERSDKIGERLLAGPQQVPPVEFVQQPLVQIALDRDVFGAALARRRRRVPRRRPSASRRAFCAARTRAAGRERSVCSSRCRQSRPVSE